MKKYIGTYRVVCEFDKATLQPHKEDTYIVCVKGGQIYRINKTTLAYYRPTRGNHNTLTQQFTDSGAKEVTNHSSDGDILICFAETSLPIVAKIVQASTNGANIPPYSIKNLRKLDWFKANKEKYIKQGLYTPPRELTEEEKQVYRDRFELYRH